MLAEIAYFMRELCGVIEIETSHNKKNKVTKEDISSNKKERYICEERHIVAFVLRNRFSKENYDGNSLSTPEIAKIIGSPEKPKNHAGRIFSKIIVVFFTWMFFRLFERGVIIEILFGICSVKL